MGEIYTVLLKLNCYIHQHDVFTPSCTDTKRGSWKIFLSQGSQLYGQNKGVVMDRIKQNLIEVFRLFPLLLPNEGQHCEALFWQEKIFL